jgi:tetratricopeptide (TPR) repeat protein
MPDIFISYSSKDRAFVVPMVEYFERTGLEVWWDQRIDAGSSYARDIEDALDAAQTVIVLWSRHSVQSDWVRAEANEGHTRGILVPVLIDDTRPPLIFRALQGIPCRFGNNADFAELIAAIGQIAPALKKKQVALTEKITASENQKHWSTPPFVGRNNLLNSLTAALSQSAQGSGQVVLLSGEPGMGKSRTAEELAQHARKKGIAVHAAWSEESMYAPPYWPIVRMLRTLIDELNPPLQRQELGRGAAVLASLLPELRELFSDIESLPEYSADHLTFEIGQALLLLFRKLAERKPILILFDDLHCSDAQTLKVFLIIARELNRGSVMILGNYRANDLASDHELRRGLVELTRSSHFAQYDLEPLPKEEVAQFFADNVAGPENLAQAVISKADGNPLYITEFARSINHEAQSGSGRSSKSLVIPSNLKNTLLERMRNLTTDCRDFLNLASVMGRRLSPDIIYSISGVSEEVGRNLIAEATSAGILDIGPSGRIRFTHILLRDTLYEDIKLDDRMNWHRALGDYYADHQTGSLGVASHCETIAHHFQLSGLIDRALDYWEQAANIARGQSAFADAITRWRQALILLTDSELPPRELIEKEIRYRLSLGLSIVTLEGSGASAAVPEYERAMNLCNDYPDSPSLFYALNAVWSYHAMHCSPAALPLVERQLTLAEQLNYDTTHVLASNAAATTRFFEGDFALACKSLETATEYWQQKLQQLRVKKKPLTSLAYTMLSPLYHAWCLALMGRAEDGLGLAKKTLSEATQMGTYCQVQALSYLACIYEVIGNYPQLKIISDQIITLATENGYQSWLAVAHCTRGMAVAQLESPEAGLVEARAGRETYEALGGVLCLTWRQCQLAEILRLNQRSEDAIKALDAILEGSQDRFEHFVDSEIYRLKGECMIELGRPEGVSWIKRAQDTAKAMSARVFEERATAALEKHANNASAKHA